MRAPLIRIARGVGARAPTDTRAMPQWASAGQRVEAVRKRTRGDGIALGAPAL